MRAIQRSYTAALADVANGTHSMDPEGLYEFLHYVRTQAILTIALVVRVRLTTCLPPPHHLPTVTA